MKFVKAEENVKTDKRKMINKNSYDGKEDGVYYEMEDGDEEDEEFK
ncbi:hypothetical protein DDB_G0287045 [Dictyostelium discoideum AX4]|nr:hypothetical protein DDB_G0287045 [Dictyostelium discoideum AX4]EAL63887.1 hypothetical protein DDB_G0287045 [Dictyostelium discoideum AX4]|eukprot:XP_637391.1 hypothetical protein DDB_G0287045 [Dictyostelium discoideum AX4]